jgi:hypothetical protein
MKRPARVLVAVLAALSLQAGAGTGQRPEARESGRFIAVDVYVDPQGEPLGAYQVEISDPSGVAQVVGIEGGDHPAYSEPPYYDPAALNAHRIILAAFSTSPRLPRTRTRVASIHCRVAGEQDPELRIRLEVAVAANGKRIPADAHLGGVVR